MQQEIYNIILVLSGAIVILSGIVLQSIAVPRNPKLHNYRVARGFLAGAFIVLGVLSLLEFFGVLEPEQQIIIAYYQALLFTYSLITLLNPRYVTRRRLLTQLTIITIISVVVVYLFYMGPEVFTPALYVSIAAYLVLFGYYVYIFFREYRRYLIKVDNFFADSDMVRMRWIRKAFYMASVVGLLAAGSMFFGQAALIVFIVCYTSFYLYFTVKYINYPTHFNLLIPAIEPAGDPAVPEGGSPRAGLKDAVCKWVEEKGFLQPGLTLESLSKELMTNQNYLSKYINLTYGQNFKSWINSLRIGEAQQILISAKDISLSEIPDMVGIPSRSTFYRQFMNVTGMSPVEYRRQFAGESPES